MKLLVVLSAFIALCAGSAIPLVPGDNSHYVEGESRYIWMPNGEGMPELVDLQATEEIPVATRNGANNAYWLYTRLNPTTPQILVQGNINSVFLSNYHNARPIKVIVHGWHNNGDSDVNKIITEALLAEGDYNVIVVDWSSSASGLYLTSVWAVPSVGSFLGDFLTWLVNTTGNNWNNVHLIGHSLGAHVIGNAGRQTGGLPARLTGLDPAGPQWGSSANAISSSDGQYVESIHTDGGLLGIFNKVADADFYPNGGKNPQPGCWLSTCSHSRAYELFAASVLFNHFEGTSCDSNLFQSCGGTTLLMGNSDLSKSGTGTFYLTTGRTWPF